MRSSLAQESFAFRRIARRGASFALTAAALVAPVSAASEHAAGKPELQRNLDQVVAAGVPGALLLVRASGRTIRLTSGYGNLKPRTPMRASDRFRVGSITKAVRGHGRAPAHE